MATFTKEKFSGSTNGRPVVVVATATGGTTIHTAVSGTSSWDEIWIYATNIDSSDITLTLEWGGTGVANEIDMIVPANSTILVIPGCLLQNSLIVKAYAGTASKINLFGWVNRIA
jgi:hypothetical protein